MNQVKPIALMNDAIFVTQFYREKVERKEIFFLYNTVQNALYIETAYYGFWKVEDPGNTGEYVLYHRNEYGPATPLNLAIDGGYHRQLDVFCGMELAKIIDYIYKHDKAKDIIAEDYRKLPRGTKKQRKYYAKEEKKAQQMQLNRVYNLFAALEQNQLGYKRMSMR